MTDHHEKTEDCRFDVCLEDVRTLEHVKRTVEMISERVRAEIAWRVIVGKGHGILTFTISEKEP